MLEQSLFESVGKTWRFQPAAAERKAARVLVAEVEEEKQISGLAAMKAGTELWRAHWIRVFVASATERMAAVYYWMGSSARLLSLEMKLMPTFEYQTVVLTPTLTPRPLKSMRVELTWNVLVSSSL